MTEEEKKALREHAKFEPVGSVDDLDDTAPMPDAEYEDLLALGREAVASGKTKQEIGRLLMLGLKYGLAAAKAAM